MTQEQEKQMQRVFPNGWEENDIPTFWRKDEEKHFNAEMAQIEAEEREVEDLEKEEEEEIE